MFQTFSGSSRRPRQVNLSGQNLNPFAASSWSPSASGSQKTLANAQQERQLRQQERERLNASKQIQRVWRGYRTRSEVANSRRAAWDQLNSHGADLIELTQLLLTFFTSRRQDDLARIVRLSLTISAEGPQQFLAQPEIQLRLVRLASIALEALQVSLPKCPVSLLKLLVAIVDERPAEFSRISQPYYTFLSSLLTTQGVHDLDKQVMMTAIKTPLKDRMDGANNDNELLTSHATFAVYFLATPNLTVQLGPLNELARSVNIHSISLALIHEFSSTPPQQLDPDRKLWLLAHFISIYRLQRRSSQDPDYLRALSLQLSSSSSDILNRIDAQDPDQMDEGDAEVTSTTVLSPLPPLIKSELLSLVDKDSISGLLEKFNIDYAKASGAGEEDASLLASYALTLLRIFPRRADDIRMWLYLGSMNTSDGTQMPALKFFWQAMRSTNTFSVIRADSKAALTLLRPQTQRQNGNASLTDVARDREWRTILLFLELYTFVLRFTDDEAFMSGSVPTYAQASRSTSRIHESALPIQDVKLLTLFLKNLAFTAYYNAGELVDGGQNMSEGSIGTYFGANVNAPRFSTEKEVTTKQATNRPFAGIAGMTFDYVRTIVTGVMQQLYERDSRRQFLPKDHWLMTSRFDMEGFIPAVVMEEERQHRIREEGEDEDFDDEVSTTHDSMTLVGMSRPRRAQQIEALRKQQQKAARQKILAQVGPRLEVLQNMPFVIPFETRVQIFRQFVLLDQTRRRGGNVDPDIWRMSVIQQSHMLMRPDRTPGHDILSRHHAKIRRHEVFEDAFDQFYDLGEGLKEPIQITFVDQFDNAEAGIDGGGVTKEFLTSITNEAFRSDVGGAYFVSNDQNLLYPNPASIDELEERLLQEGGTKSDLAWREALSEMLKRYEFLGRVVGKCLYEGILVDISFAGFFLLKWAISDPNGYKPSINDLKDFDDGLYQGLLKLKNYPGNVEDFSLDFTIIDEVNIPGQPTRPITRDLAPNGANISVTNENALVYISCVAHHRLAKQPGRQTNAFLKGLREIINPSWLSMFNQAELQTLIGGDSSGIDVEDLRQNTQYGGVYQIGDDGEEHPTIKLFWKVMHSLDDVDRRKVLKYVTSTPRAPLLGFSQLNPRFSIRDSSSDEERLPSTSTCVNLLKLPRYSTEATLRSKLLYAVNSGAGFDLS